MRRVAPRRPAADRRPHSPLLAIVAASLLAAALPALASTPEAALPEQRPDLSLIWGLPFAGLLVSIALAPLAAPRIWHAHYGKIAAAWALAFAVPFALVHGPGAMLHEVLHAILFEYLPFVAILFSLFTIAGGICVRGTLAGTPGRNTALLALGASLASVMGTTGASMLLIRPLLTANEGRRHRAHAVVFFILLVGNVGGALSPLGDPPLFIGYLKGVEFFWTTRALALPTLLLAGALLAVFWLLDAWFYRHEQRLSLPATAAPKLAIEGWVNVPLLAGVVAAVLLSGAWDPGVSWDVIGAPLELQNVVRDVLLVALALLSLALTPRAAREHNQFHWAPIVEVARIFACIFVAIIPVLAMLEAGRAGALGAVIDLVVDADGRPRDTMIFWTTGLLSSFLDNAPTYLVFFNLAGGDAQRLMGPLGTSLAALSMGAVYFGALTYIGNAPNFMIKAIAEDRGVAMPSFFAYFAYAGAVMLPLLAIIGWLFL